MTEDKRPRTQGGQITTTPDVAKLVDLLGGYQSGGVTLSNDEVRSLRKFYGIADDRSENALIQAGNLRNMMRLAQVDGLRLMAWLAKYLNGGEDPVKFMIYVFTECHWDEEAVWETWPEEEEKHENS